ncbi:unnamed protein product [Eretmochelys imbricata]
MGAGRILGAGSHWAVALLVTLTVLRTHLAHCTEPPEHFLFQAKSECLFAKGTGRVRYLQRYVWDRQPFVHFDSDVGRFAADTELGRGTAEGWNKDPAILAERRAALDTFCRHNYGSVRPFSVDRRGSSRCRDPDLAGRFPNNLGPDHARESPYPWPHKATVPGQPPPGPD